MMISLFAWICLSYGLAAYVVNWVYKRSVHEAPLTSVHYVLVTRNHASQLEWYLRAINWHSLLRSIPHKVTLMDDHSADDTLAIADKMGSTGMDLRVVGMKDKTLGEVKERHLMEDGMESLRIVDLRKPGEASKIPYVHIS